MKLRTLTAALAVLSLTAGLAACGDDDKDADPGATETSGSDTTAGSDTTVASGLPDLEGRTVTVAVENAYVPFNYINQDTNEGEGWDYDVWAEICARLNCVAEFKEAAWDGMIQAVSDNQFDVAADGITITDERKEVVDFSTGYIKVAQRLLVVKGEDRFASLDEFKAGDFTIGTQTGTTNYDTAVSEYGEGRVTAFETFPFAVQALINGDVDAVIIDDTAGQGYAGADKEKLELLVGDIVSDELGFVFPKESDLLEPVNAALAAMTEDGTLDEINGRFFSPDFEAPVAD
jgi:polar amino acid transport system substrate-binding protein